jgi:uncharacterized protein YpmB
MEEVFITNQKSGQGALEFAVIFGFVIFFFVVFLGIIERNLEDKNSEKEGIVLQSVALEARDEINLAAGSSEGYYRVFKIQENILGKNYFINVTDGFVYASLGNKGFSYKTANVTGSLKKGVNIINKTNGTVYLN